MDSKDIATYPSLDSRTKRPLHLDSIPFAQKLDDDYPTYSAASSPGSANTVQSPNTPYLTPSLSRDSESADLESDREPSSGPQRTRSASANLKSEKEKRKRSRVTPEQLVHLERFFTVDRSPTAARRKEISDLLSMQERQTQIWFQNRRAKAKLQDCKHKGGRSGSAETPPDTPPELSTGFEVDLHNLIHEDEPVTIIPCSDLSIGSWRRIATTVGKHDLVAYVCDIKRCLTWFIHSGGYGFKMDIPFEIIVETEFTNAAPGSGLASFVLSQPPIFYLENVSSPGPDGLVSRHWKQCSDWTEGHQATHVLRHDLIGSAVQLAHVLRNITASPVPDIPLHRPSYRPDPPPMELPPPPMAGLAGPAYYYRENYSDDSRQDHHNRQRSFSGPAPIPYPSDDTEFAPGVITPRPATSFFPQGSGRPLQSTPVYSSQLYNEYMEPDPPQRIAHHPQPLDDYTAGPVSIPRTYPVQPSRQYYNDELRLGSYQSPSTVATPSPPLLTTPYYPPPHLTENPRNGHSKNMSSIVISGLPGYDAEDSAREDAS